LERTKDKWFVNLSNTTILHEVSILLQFGDRFCLPLLSNKELAIHEFIKDIECNMTVHKIHNQFLIRNTAIQQFHKFLKNTPPRNIINENLLHLQHRTQQFCRDNLNIIFTKADKRNITVAMDKKHYINEINDLLKDVNTYMMVKKNSFSRIGYKKDILASSNSSNCGLAILSYPRHTDFPKSIKKNTPFRIIVSSVNIAL